MKRSVLVIALILSSTSCATSTRPKANLAIDSEPTPTTRPATHEPAQTQAEDEYSEAIELGFEGRSGPVQIEAAMSPEGEETAIASQRRGEKKKRERRGDIQDDDASDEVDEDQDLAEDDVEE